MKKSKSQKAAGWLLTTAGATGLVVTLISDATQAVAGGFTTILSLGTVEPKYKSYTAYYLLSAAGVGTGIAFFVASAKNRKKATTLDASAFLKIENAPMLQRQRIFIFPYPSIALKAHF